MNGKIISWKKIEKLCEIIRPHVGKLDKHPELKKTLKELNMHISRLENDIHGSIIEHEARAIIAESRRDFRNAAIEISREIKKIIELYDTFIGCQDNKIYEFTLVNRKPRQIARKAKIMLYYCKMAKIDRVSPD
ncbi:MAG TPA: hypothetical protein VLO11_13060 [Luteolibacter sp.]|nr:hypothetical protein [Luteolibacter sp.]